MRTGMDGGMSSGMSDSMSSSVTVGMGLDLGMVALAVLMLLSGVLMTNQRDTRSGM